MTAVETVEVEGRLGVVVAELSGDVLRLTRELHAVREELATYRAELGREIRTGRIVLDDADKSTTIEPGMVQLHHRRTESDDSGSFVLLTALSHSGEMVAGAVLRECDDPMVYAAIGASTEIEPASAYVALNTHKSVGGEVHEIAVEMKEPTPCSPSATR